MVNHSAPQLLIRLSIILCLAWSCNKNTSNQQTTPQESNSRDSPEIACKELVAEMEAYIENELNHCRVHSDCIVASGTCPLGPFFIVNRENENLLDSIILEVDKTCGPCKYDMPEFPSTVICKDLKCYPGYNESSSILMLVGYDCLKIANLYKEELIGKKFQNLQLNEHLYRVVPEKDIEVINAPDPERGSRIKVIVDLNGYIKALDCDL